MPATTHEVARPEDYDEVIEDFLDGVLMGEVGFSIETSDSGTFTTTPTQIGAVTFSEVTGTVYYVTCGVHLVSTGTDIYQATMYENSTAGTEVAGRRTDSRTSDQLRPNVLRLRYRYTASATGSKTFVVTGHRVSGGGNVFRDAGTDHPQLFRVEKVLNP